MYLGDALEETGADVDDVTMVDLVTGTSVEKAGKGAEDEGHAVVGHGLLREHVIEDDGVRVGFGRVAPATTILPSSRRKTSVVEEEEEEELDLLNTPLCCPPSNGPSVRTMAPLLPLPALEPRGGASSNRRAAIASKPAAWRTPPRLLLG